MYQYSTTKIVFIQNNVKKHWNIYGGGRPFRITPMQHKSFKKIFLWHNSCRLLISEPKRRGGGGGGGIHPEPALSPQTVVLCHTMTHHHCLLHGVGGTLEARVTKDRILRFLRQVGLPSAVPPTRFQLPIQGLTNNSVSNGQRHAKSSPPHPPAFSFI